MRIVHLGGYAASKGLLHLKYFILRLTGQGKLVFGPAMRIVHHGGYVASKGGMHLKYLIRSGVRFFNHHGWSWI